MEEVEPPIGGMPEVPVPVPSDRSKLDDRPVKAKKPMSSTKRMFVIFSKTWSDCFTAKKLIIVLIMMAAIPMVSILVPAILMPASTPNYGAISTYSASMQIMFSLLPMLYMWVLGMVLCIVVTGQAAGTIADEVDRGTMLLLVSKPVSRIQIYFGKFLAIFLFGALLSFLGLFTLSWIMVLALSGNLAHFVGMLPFIGFMFLYSLFVNLIFLSMTMALSSIMSQGRKVGMIMILLVALTFFVFFLIRFMAGDYYSQFYLYWVDIGYHLGNVLVYFIQLFNVLPPSSLWETGLNTYTGVFNASVIDPSQGIDLGGLALNGYVNPLVSLAIWVGLALLLTFVGLQKLSKKEISG